MQAVEHLQDIGATAAAGRDKMSRNAGLSNASVRGMVAAHIGARHVGLSKLAAPAQRPHVDDWLRHLLAAVAAGGAARWQGRRGEPVESLGLSGCAALTDADVELLSDSMPDLR